MIVTFTKVIVLEMVSHQIEPSPLYRQAVVASSIIPTPQFTLHHLAAQGWLDAAIADELADATSRTPRFGTRLLTKDTIAAIRRSWFPREFSPGCGHGTIETPSGELVEGKHQAAWPYDLWQRMVETKAKQYRRPRVQAHIRAHEFSRILVCSACRRQLAVANWGGIPYYRDTSAVRKLECSIGGFLSIRADIVIYQVGDLLSSVELPEDWREVIVKRYAAEVTEQDQSIEQKQQRREELETEQKRLVMAFSKGYLSEQDLDEQVGQIREELVRLAVPAMRSIEEVSQAAISAGETLVDMVEYWCEATVEGRRDIVWSLFTVSGLVYDLERRSIVGMIPRASMLPVLALGLEHTARWEQREQGLWLHAKYLPPKRQRENTHLPPPQAPSLTPVQQREARGMVDQGMSLRQVARHFGTSYESIRRMMQKGEKAEE